MRKSLAIALTMSILLASCGKQEIEEKKFYKTYSVSQGVIVGKDSILTTVEGAHSAQLSFKNPGRIKTISVRQGDRVKQGQVLATLSNEEADISLAGSQDILAEIGKMGIDISSIGSDTSRVKEALSELYDARIKLSENDSEKSQIAVQMAEKDLDLARTTLTSGSETLSGTLLSSDQKVKQAQNAYEMAKSNLENSKRLLGLERENMEKNALNSLTNAYIVARNARDAVDSILGITDANRSKNDAFEEYLGAKDATLKTTAEASFRAFASQYDRTNALYQSEIVSRTDIPKETLVKVLQNALDTLNSLRNLLHVTMDVLDHSITSARFDESTLQGMKSQISTLIANLEQAILNPTAVGMTGVKGSIEALDSFDRNYDLKIKQLEDAVNLASDDLNLAKTGKQITASDNTKNISGLTTNVSIKEDNLQLAKISRDESEKAIALLKDEKRSKLAELDAKLGEIRSKLGEVGSKAAEARMNGNMAKNGVESGIIRAPFDGIILRKMSDVGTVVGAGMPVFSVTSTDSRYVKTAIDNSAYGLKVGSVVSLSSEKQRMSATGTVMLLNETQDPISKKNAIEVMISDERVAYGERFILQVGSERKDEQPVVPLSAIVSKYAQPGVFVLEDGIAKFRIITLKESDDAFVAVGGLKIGDKVITEGKDNVMDGEKL